MHTVAIGADHGGFELKQLLAEHIRSRGLAVEDCGTHSTEAVDYPKIAAEVAQRVADGRADIGVIVDGAGIGSSMTANKFPGVRAALCYDLSSARNSREPNNANVLTLGASLIGAGLAKQIVDTFLDTECTADRHLRRAAMIDDIDNQYRRGDSNSQTPAPPGVFEKHKSVESGARQSPAEPGPDASKKLSTTNSNSTELSEADLRRVADRISQLIGTSAGGGHAAHACTEACGFCQSCA